MVLASARINGMSFAVSLASDNLSVDPGSTQPLSVGVSNKGTEPDHFEVRVEGLDPAWTTMPVESFTIEPGETQVQKALIRVPREAESAAGSYPFVVVVRSLNTGDGQTAEAILEVTAFHQLSMDVDPKRLVLGGLKPEAEFEVTVINLGNLEHELQLFASDPENEIAFSFEHEKISVGPGQQRKILAQASSRRKAILANGKLYGVNFSARSVIHPTVAAYTQSQLELRPVVTPAPFFTVLTVLAIGAAWFATIPKPPKIELFSSDRKEIKVGEAVTVNYQVADANSVSLFKNDELLKTSGERAGNFSFIPSDPGQYTLRLEAKKNDKRDTRTITIQVAPPDVIPAPEITDFRVNKTVLNEDETLIVYFAVNSAVKKIEIRPNGYIADATSNKAEFKPIWMGKSPVTILASNEKGETVQRSIEVTVRALQPEISAFSLSTNKPVGQDARVTVRWTLKNCTRAEIEWDGVKTPVDSSTGTFEVFVNKVGNVILRGFDAKGTKVERIKLVEWLPEPESADPGSPGGTTPVTPPTTGPN